MQQLEFSYIPGENIEWQLFNNFLKHMVGMYQLFDSYAFNQKKLKYILYKDLFIAALYVIIAPNQKRSKCSSVDEWINELLCGVKIQCYSVI